MSILKWFEDGAVYVRGESPSDEETMQTMKRLLIALTIVTVTIGLIAAGVAYA